MFFNLKLHGVWSLTTYFNPITLNTWVMTAGAVVMGGMSIASNTAQNKQTATNRDLSIDQANKEAKANAKATLQSYNLAVNTLNQQAQEVRNQAGMELTQAKLDGLKNEATTSAVVADRGFVGATASRLNEMSNMGTELLSDQIRQKAESNMVDIMNKLTESKYNYENGMMSSAIASSRSATQIDIAARAGTVSTLGMVSGAVGAGAQGAVTAKQLKS